MNDILNEKKGLNKEKKAKRPQCKYCGKEISFIVKYCPNCGEELY